MDKTYTYPAFHHVLSIAGISIFATKNWDSKSWLALQIFDFIIGIFCFIFTTGFVVTHVSDLLLFIQSACIWTTGVMMTVSLGVCLFFRKDFRNFLEEMAFKDNMKQMPFIQLVLKMDQGQKLMELKALVEESQENLQKYTNILLKIYFAGVFVVATMYLCTPIYVIIERKDSSLRLLAFDMWFPWSLKDVRVYVASFIFHAYCGYLCSIAYPGLQSTIFYLMGQLIRQLRILTFILLHLDELVEEITGSDRGRWQQYCTAVLAEVIDHHAVIKTFSNKLNIICRPFYLTLILDAIMLVCASSVKIAISDKLSPDTIKYYVHELMFILVVLMFCLLGQQVENECEFLERAVTEKWYIFDKKHKKNLLIFNVALSQRMPIYIFGTITLSLPTFTWFIKTGMSFFTLMMSFLEDSLFVLGMVGYCRLLVQIDMALVQYMVRVLRGELHQPAVLAALWLRAPNDYLGARRRPSAGGAQL